MADVVADPLRERLQKLVEEWSTPWGSSPALYARYLTASTFADQLSALLAESEPEPSFSDVTATRCLRHATIPPTILPPASQECGLCMREEGVLVGRSEQRPEIAWLIESRLTPSPTWWTGADWTPDSLKAVRFCRKQDAEAALATLPDKHVCFTSEHQWGFGVESEPDPLRKKLRALVEELQKSRYDSDFVLSQLAAILDETEEPEACSEWRHCEHDGEDGHVACDVLCADCGMRLETHPPKPLPLDHAFTSMMGDRCEAFLLEAHGRYHQCDQPREAHE